MSAPDLLAVERELSREECETLIAAMRPLSRPRTLEGFEALINSPDRRVRALERHLLIHSVEVSP
jgi:hypothetical protein